MSKKFFKLFLLVLAFVFLVNNNYAFVFSDNAVSRKEIKKDDFVISKKLKNVIDEYVKELFSNDDETYLAPLYSIKNEKTNEFIIPKSFEIKDSNNKTMHVLNPFYPNDLSLNSGRPSFIKNRDKDTSDRSAEFMKKHRYVFNSMFSNNFHLSWIFDKNGDISSNHANLDDENFKKYINDKNNNGLKFTKRYLKTFKEQAKQDKHNYLELLYNPYDSNNTANDLNFGVFKTTQKVGNGNYYNLLFFLKKDFYKLKVAELSYRNDKLENKTLDFKEQKIYLVQGENSSSDKKTKPTVELSEYNNKNLECLIFYRDKNKTKREDLEKFFLSEFKKMNLSELRNLSSDPNSDFHSIVIEKPRSDLATEIPDEFLNEDCYVFPVYSSINKGAQFTNKPDFQKNFALNLSNDNYNVSNAIPSSQMLDIDFDFDNLKLIDYTNLEKRRSLDINIYYWDKREADNSSIQKFYGTLSYDLLESRINNFTLNQINSIKVQNEHFKNAVILDLPKIDVNITDKNDYKSISHKFNDSSNSSQKILIDITKEKDLERYLKEKINNINYAFNYSYSDASFHVVFGSQNQKTTISQNYINGFINKANSEFSNLKISDSISLKYDDNTILNNFYNYILDNLNAEYPIKKLSENIAKESSAKLTLDFYDFSNDVKSTVIKSKDSQKIKIKGNRVSVHTPVYSDIKIENDEKEKIIQSDDIKENQFAISDTFELKLSSKGQHINELGYMDSNYSEFMEKAFLILPFDAYISEVKKDLIKNLPNESFFLKKGNKFIIDKSKLKNDLSLFVKPALWTDEGEYSLEFYSIAENSNASSKAFDYKTELTANIDKKNYIAKSVAKLNLKGRIYDFRIEKAKGRFFDKNESFLSGNRDFYGNKLKLKKNQSLLPVLKRDRVGNKELRGLSLGEGFIFTLKTIGNYLDKNEKINIRPKFYYIDENGKIDSNIEIFHKYRDSLISISEFKNRQKNLPNNSEILLGDKIKIIENNNRVYRNLKESNVSANTYLETVLSNLKGFNFLNFDISYDLKSFIGYKKSEIPKGVDEIKSISSIQKWSGFYFLPSSALVIKRDKNGDIRILRDGKLAVVFEIELRDKNKQKNISYVSKFHNQWEKEAYSKNKHNISFPYGTVVIYNLNDSSSDRFSVY